VCDNIRIPHCRILRGEEYRGYIASKKRYFYGIRIHLISTAQGVPVEWVFLPASAHDTRGLSTLPLNLPQASELYTDKGYTDFLTEDNLARESSINLMTIRKKNSTRPDSLCLAYIKRVWSKVVGKRDRFPPQSLLDYHSHKRASNSYKSYWA
jgi:IS5 family transposase